MSDVAEIILRTTIFVATDASTEQEFVGKFKQIFVVGFFFDPPNKSTTIFGSKRLLQKVEKIPFVTK